MKNDWQLAEPTKAGPVEPQIGLLCSQSIGGWPREYGELEEGNHFQIGKNTPREL